LCLLKKDGMLWLGQKKQGFGQGKFNGFGGKQKEGETIEQTAVRELTEETSVVPTNMHKAAEMTYRFEHEPSWNQVVHVYIVTDWTGTPTESEEMTCEKFPVASIPYDKMWDNDKHWLPQVLDGKKVKGAFIHTDKTTVDAKIDVVDHF
jgi:ADP-ribose pyrophosphatase YjhB (NUDIX family)